MSTPIVTVAAGVTQAVDALTLVGVPFAGTLFEHYFDESTGLWADSVAAYTASAAITPTTGKAYSHIAVVESSTTLTAAQCKVAIGGVFP